ncbi:MAG: tetratricopeptide repeat protein [Planctomycetota bacterium]
MPSPARFAAPSAALVLAITLACPAPAADIRGAQAAIAAIQDEPAPASAPLTLDDRYAQWMADVDAMPPEQAAQGWLDLVDAWSAESHESSIAWRQLVQALPHPDAWDAMQQAVDAIPASRDIDASLHRHALQLATATLHADRDRTQQAMLDLAKTIQRLPSDQRRWLADTLADIQLHVAAVDSDPAQLVDAITRQIAQARAHQRDMGHTPTLEMPDLVARLGHDQAEALLRDAIVSHALVSIEEGQPTAALARRLAIELVDDMKTPQWSLVRSPQDLTLFEALVARFEPPADEAPNEQDNQDAQDDSNQGFSLGGMLRSLMGADNPEPAALAQHDWNLDFARERAERTYLLALISAGRIEDAIARLDPADGSPVEVGLPYNAVEIIVENGFAEQAFALLDRLVADNPASRLWPRYIQLAGRLARTDHALEQIEAALQRDDLTPATRNSLLARLADARLANDDVAAGVAALQRVAANHDDPDDAFDAAARIVELGRVLDRPDLTDAGLAAAQAAAAVATDPFDTRVELAALLAKAGQQAQAEGLLIDALHEIEQAPRHGHDESHRTAELLGELTALYFDAGRPADVVALLEDAPWWRANDLMHLDLGYRFDGSILHIAAQSLAEVGRTEEAVRIARYHLLHGDAGHDPSYLLIIRHAQADALSLFELLAKRDPFEERPLIFSARVKLNQNRIAEAEADARAAIAIDPSDGEQGKGDRMRAYAVLADVLRAKGELDNAAFFDDVLKAIRLSERADDVYAAGLLTRGIEMYQRALEFFDAAYCIQSRMAVQLAEAGRLEEAAVHYRRAYELMPSSFGRVESHCFGCEGAFSGSFAQQIADDVFTQLAQEQPDNPQVHYLLGYLRSAQDRDADALTHYRRAVELDPDYLNAWDKIADLTHELALPAEQRDEASLQLIRLDPLQRRTYPKVGHIADLAAMWRTVEASGVHRVTPPDELFPLPASQRQLEELARIDPHEAAWLSRRSAFSDGTNDRRPAAALLTRHPIFRSLEHFIAYESW